MSGRSQVNGSQAIAYGFIQLLASQVSLRLINFYLNLLIARHLSPEAYGLFTVRFHLIITTIMMLSREGFRKGCQRLKHDEQHGTTAVHPWRLLSVAGLVVPIGLFVATCVCAAATMLYKPTTEAIPAYERAVYLHGLAATIELLGEPFYILATVNLQFRLRVVMDSLPLTVKAAVTLSCVAGWFGPTFASLPPAVIFATAQLSLSVVSCLGYWVAGTCMLRHWAASVDDREHVQQQGAMQQRVLQAGCTGKGQLEASLEGAAMRGKDRGMLLGKGRDSKGGITRAGKDLPLIGDPVGGSEVAEMRRKGTGGEGKGHGHGEGRELEGGHSKSSLAEGQGEGVTKTDKVAGAAGERRLLSWGPAELEALASSGIFAVQAAEKLVLAEGSKIAVASLATSYDQGVVGLVGNLGSLIVRTLFQPLEELSFAAFSRYQVGDGDVPGLTHLAHVLSLLVKAMSLVGLVAVSFGPPHARIVIRLIYGQHWAQTEAPAVLSVYCLYILLLAVNGVTEAFTHAVLDHAALAASNLAMVVFTLLHVLACFGLITTLGNRGLILADGLAMILRICLSAWYIRHFFKLVPGLSVSKFLPRPITLAAFAAMHAALSVVQSVIIPPFSVKGAQSQFTLFDAALGVAVGVVGLGIVAGVAWRTEQESISGIRMLLQTRRGSREEEVNVAGQKNE